MDNITEAIVIEEEAPRRGRRPAARSGAAPAPAVEQQAAGLVADLRRDSITMPRQELAQSLHMAGATGMIAAFQYNETANRVAMLKLFAQIRDSKAYKGASVVDRNGETRVVSTWEEFCTAHGYSKRKIDEDLQNLAAFGGDFMEMQEKLGLGYRDLRLLRNGIAALPPEERQAVLDDVAAADDSEEVKARLADLRLELAKARADRKELEADMQAKDKVSKEKSEKLDRLEEQVARLTSMSPDERQKALDEKNLAAELGGRDRRPQAPDQPARDRPQGRRGQAQGGMRRPLRATEKRYRGPRTGARPVRPGPAGRTLQKQEVPRADLRHHRLPGLVQPADHQKNDLGTGAGRSQGTRHDQLHPHQGRSGQGSPAHPRPQHPGRCGLQTDPGRCLLLRAQRGGAGRQPNIREDMKGVVSWRNNPITATISFCSRGGCNPW